MCIINLRVRRAYSYVRQPNNHKTTRLRARQPTEPKPENGRTQNIHTPAFSVSQLVDEATPKINTRASKGPPSRLGHDWASTLGKKTLLARVQETRFAAKFQDVTR